MLVFCVVVCVHVFLAILLILMLFRRANAAGGTRAGKIRKPIELVLEHPEKISYNQVMIPLTPPQTGKVVRFLVRYLQHSILGRYVLGPSNKAKAGLDILLGEYIPEKATFAVYMPVPERTNCIGNKTVLQNLIEARNCKAFPRTSCVDFYNAFSQGKCDPIEVANIVLKAIDSSNSSSLPLRAIVEYDQQEVRRMAEESKARWSKGKPLSFLDGVPISIKGQFNVYPYQCTGGCSFQPTVAKDLPESVAVKRLKEAGAVIIGIANMQEAAAGTYGSNPNKMNRIARNPYNTDFFCGGSSSGSGCSVSAGICPISMGSDDGGSIRIPAAFCGVFGLKPTYGLLDTTGFAPISQTVGVIGPLASSPIDIAITMSILCPDEMKLDLSNLVKDDISDIKVGVYWDYFEHANEEIVFACKAAVKKMTNLGATCISIKIPELEEVTVAHLVSACTEFSSSLAVDVDSHFGDLSAETLSLVGLGYTCSGTEYLNSQKQRTRTIHVLQKLFADVDVIVTPVLPCVAPKIPPNAEAYGLLSNEYLAFSCRFTLLANLTGIPSIAVPVGFSSANSLPISLQIMGPWYQEGMLLQIANLLEKELPQKLPEAVYYNVLRK